jgi:PAS domain S-box-containing protein
MATPRSIQEDSARLQFWLESSSDWLWEIDAEGCYTYVGPRCRELLGYSPEQLMGVHWSLMMLNFEGCTRLQSRLSQAESFEEELPCLHYLGYGVTLWIKASPRWFQGCFTGFRGITRDVSARRSAALVLQEAGAMTSGEVGNFFGQLTQSIQSALAVDSQQALSQMEQANQLLVSRVSQRTLALRESEGQFQQIFEQSPSALAILALSGMIERINPAFAELVAHSLDPIDRSLLALNQGHDPFIGTCPMTLLAIDDDRLFDQIQQWLAEPKASFRQEFLHGPEAQKSWGLLTLRIVWDISGQPAAILLIIQDIDDRKQLEAQQARFIDGLALVNQQLARATQLKDEFLATMSHELRTPLNSILGLTEGLCEQVYGDLTPRQLKSLQTIDRNGQHLLSLINDILDLAKIEAGKLELTYGWVSIRGVCETSLGVVQPLAQRKGVEVEFEGVGNGDVGNGDVGNGDGERRGIEEERQWGRIWADERRVQQILVNLLDNAIKFTAVGGRVRLGVEAGAESPDEGLGQRIVFSVQDNGLGIEAELLPLLFEPFVQAQGLARSGGTGLGLALVKRLAQLHGGQVSVESQPGLGSCFRVALPRVEPQDKHLVDGSSPRDIG